MSEEQSKKYSLYFTKKEMMSLERAIQIVISRDPVAKAASSSADYVRKSMDNTKEYFHSNLEYQIAILSLSLGMISSPLYKFGERTTCSNGCEANCTISCVSDCNQSCKGKCKGSCGGTCYSTAGV